jgi:methionyl-tRNA formyltransferase
MNIIFFGSSHFAVCALEALEKSDHKILCVVTQPDRKKGRGLHCEGTAVKGVAEALRLKIYQPLNINTAEAVQFLKSQNADLLIVISYGQILSQEVLNIPKLFSINAHASLLPQYRGAAPINWALINGEETSGVTIMKMEKKMDAGPMMMQQSLRILEQDTAVTLEEKLSGMAGALLMEALDKMNSKNYDLIAQDEKKASFAPKLKKEDGLIDWQKSAFSIYNLIRGCVVWPGAFTYYKGKLLKIFKASVVRRDEPVVGRGPGKIIKVFKQGILVATGKDDLLIKELQIQGRKIVAAQEFIAGHPIAPDDAFDKN